MRTGAHALSLLLLPLNVHVLLALEDGPRPLVELRRAAGSPPQTTMRKHLRVLTDTGVLSRHRQSEFPGPVGYELGRAGNDLLGVARVLQDWLRHSPEGPIDLGSSAAKGSIKALIDGWSSGVVRVLAAKPFSLTELSSIIPGFSYPSLERRLGAMRLAGQIERCDAGGRGTPYGVTNWLRRAIAPLAAAARWERRHHPDETPSIGKIDVESAFLLTLPLLGLSAEESGVCRFAVESQNGAGEMQLAGVTVGVEDGQVVSCVSRFKGNADAWAVGSASAWLQAVIERQPDQLEIGGDCGLATSILDGLHSTLFRPIYTR